MFHLITNFNFREFNDTQHQSSSCGGDMKVHELIALLIELPKEHEVILSKDGEGNGFSPLADFGLSMYEAHSTWSGEVFCEEDAKDQGRKYKENAVILWPTN